MKGEVGDGGLRMPRSCCEGDSDAGVQISPGILRLFIFLYLPHRGNPRPAVVDNDRSIENALNCDRSCCQLAQ
ncbi:hypothetical protein BKA56DRAFT_572507 [Ilyonectria sp. MPI-CAGE-AT-0026]|nr:hypothetical protein BKA56DRAFT_572507 [Ilyonectria sp. MPI-CAGE-AT-0026]